MTPDVKNHQRGASQLLRNTVLRCNPIATRDTHCVACVGSECLFFNTWNYELLYYRADLNCGFTLQNGGAKDGFDMNVAPAWQKGYTGKGVVVSILDDGIQTNHPDLALNYVSTPYI